DAIVLRIPRQQPARNTGRSDSPIRISQKHRGSPGEFSAQLLFDSDSSYERFPKIWGVREILREATRSTGRRLRRTQRQATRLIHDPSDDRAARRIVGGRFAPEMVEDFQRQRFGG